MSRTRTTAGTAFRDMAGLRDADGKLRDWSLS